MEAVRERVRNVPAAIQPGYHARVRQDVLPLLPPGGGTLLDVGGGTGATASWLREIGRADRVGVLDRVPATERLGFSAVGDIEDGETLGALIAREGPFQTVLCLDVLEHLRDPWAIVRRLHRGLAPGGVIIASIPNVRNFTALAPLLLRNRWDLKDAGVLDRTHLRFFVRNSAIQLMTSSGLVLDGLRANPSGGRSVRVFRALTGGLLNSFTDLQYLIRVRNSGAEPQGEGPCVP